MKSAFISDLHISESKRLLDTSDILRHIAGLLYKEDVDVLFVLGDVFDKRKPTPSELAVFNEFIHDLEWLRSKGHPILGHGIVILEGNHDTDGKISGLQYLEDLKIPGVMLVKPPFSYNGFYLDHRPLIGAKTDSNFEMYEGASLPEIIKQNPGSKVFAFGDFHKPQVLLEKPFCFYAGSINKLTFAERGDTKFLWIFDGHTVLKKTALPGKNLVQFDINIDEDTDADAPWEGKDYEGCISKIVYHGTKEALRQINVHDTVKRMINNLKFESVKIEYDVTNSGSARNEKITESVTDEVALTEYISQLDLSDELKAQMITEGTTIVKESTNGTK